MRLSPPPSAEAQYRGDSRAAPTRIVSRPFLEVRLLLSGLFGNKFLVLSSIPAFIAKLVIHKRIHVLSRCRVLRLSQASDAAQTFQTHSPLVCQAQDKRFVVSRSNVFDFGCGEDATPFSKPKMVPGRPRAVPTPP